MSEVTETVLINLQNAAATMNWPVFEQVLREHKITASQLTFLGRNHTICEEAFERFAAIHPNAFDSCIFDSISYSISVLKVLIKRGLMVATRVPYALHIACIYRDAEMIKLLCEGFRNLINAKDGFGNTALMWLVSSAVQIKIAHRGELTLEMVQFMLDMGADPAITRSSMSLTSYGYPELKPDEKVFTAAYFAQTVTPVELREQILELFFKKICKTVVWSNDHSTCRLSYDKATKQARSQILTVSGVDEFSGTYTVDTKFDITNKLLHVISISKADSRIVVQISKELYDKLHEIPFVPAPAKYSRPRKVVMPRGDDVVTLSPEFAEFVRKHSSLGGQEITFIDAVNVVRMYAITNEYANLTSVMFKGELDALFNAGSKRTKKCCTFSALNKHLVDRGHVTRSEPK